MSLKKTKELLQELNIRPKKSLGQSFLINQDICEEIVEEIRKSQAPWVEIGPGLGALTNFFEKNPEDLLLIEKDRRLANYLTERGFTTICQDALKVSWEDLPRQFTLFGNLPYQITNPLIIQATENQTRLHKLICMIQKEVSLRWQAKTSSKDYSWISVFVQTFWHIKLLLEVGTQDFYPKPQVAGHTLVLEKKPATLCPTRLMNLLKTCFAYRRKKLFKKIPSPKQETEKIFKQLNWNLNIRAEEIEPEEFLKLYKILESRTA